MKFYWLEDAYLAWWEERCNYRISMSFSMFMWHRMWLWYGV